MRTLNISYAVWKTLVQGNSFAHCHRWRGDKATEDDHEVVEVYAGHRDIVLRASLSGADETDWDTTFKASSTEQPTDDDAVATLYGTMVEGFTSSGERKVVVGPREGSEKYIYTHNLCDAATWFETAATVTEATATDSGDQVTWDATGHVCFIDLRHGRMFKEDSMTDQADYDVLVEVSTDAGATWAPKTENTWETADGDFDFNYEEGKVVFNSALGGSDQVRVSGEKMVNSLSTIKPAAGKRLKLEYVEVQYMSDIVLNTNVTFEIYGYVQVFAPALWDGYDPPGPYPTNTLIPLVKETYKRIQDFFSESTGPFPTIEAHGGAYVVEEVVGASNIQDKLNDGYAILGISDQGPNWTALMSVRAGDRAMKHPLITIPFKYLAFRDVRSSYGMEIRVCTANDVQLGGTFASVTFYCTSETE